MCHKKKNSKWACGAGTNRGGGDAGWEMADGGTTVGETPPSPTARLRLAEITKLKCWNSSNRSKLEGNTITSRTISKQCSPAKKWCFTLNNFTNEDIQKLKVPNSSIVPEISMIQFQEEIGESGTKHLQGWIKFSKKIRPLVPFQKYLGHGHIHWEKMRGSIKENTSYCSKAGGSNLFSKGVPVPIVKMTYDLLRPKQKAIADCYIEDEDPLFGREIHWYWEPDGGWGKSILTKYMVDCMGAIIVSGACKDALHGVADWIRTKEAGPRIIVFDIPRCNAGHVSYQAIEAIKNGTFFSGKYESGMVRFNSPHVIIFSNQPPEYEALSQDRWVVKRL